ncbi:hypothetical protein CKM354_000920600 [Cercospora kikuchii]|uniref:F-box domain-containing protein n=1 Tax=Cercospora kikuchii TaxID=84275 RepID=A0A9P3FJ13_9PEZI|nr:uncharacterized protein CKM354_000920600 [Cercospora kikuchii]GIZ46067.1 hypothetical protein CKM354_000920600 [Cercospora kikuchii]
MATHAATGMGDMPPELLTTIAEYLDRQDIIAFRSISPAFAAAADDGFLNAHFTERNHLVTEQSLEVLLTICRDERLSSRMQRINLLAMEPEAPDAQVSTMSPVIDTFDPFVTPQQYQDRLAVLQKWDRADQILLWRPELMDAICEALSQLPHTPQITISNDSIWRENHSGMNSALRRLAPHVIDSIKMVPSRWSRFLDPQLWYNTVILHWPVEWCSLGFSSRRTWNRDDRYVLAGTHAIPNLTWPAYLTALQLGLDHLESGQPTEGLERAFLAISSAVNLRRLSIRSASSFEGVDDPSTSPLPLFTSSLSCSSIQSLEVIGFFATAQQYIALLAAAGEELEHIRLQRLTLPENECWSEVLRYVATSHELASFDASYLYRGGDSTYLYSRSDSHQMHFQGKRKTNSGLWTLIHDPVYGAL